MANHGDDTAKLHPEDSQMSAILDLHDTNKEAGSTMPLVTVTECLHFQLKTDYFVGVLAFKLQA